MNDISEVQRKEFVSRLRKLDPNNFDSFIDAIAQVFPDCDIDQSNQLLADLIDRAE